MSVLKVYSEVDPNSLEVFESFKDIKDKLTEIANNFPKLEN